jgi:hypothetical protein
MTFEAPARAAGLCLAIGLGLGTVRAEVAERPRFKVGDRWEFAVYYSVRTATPSRIWIVTSVAADRVQGTENGEPLVLTADGNVLESPRFRESNPRSLQFPLEPGKRWRYESDWTFHAKGSRGSIAMEVAVERVESIEVAAGEFTAFRLSAKGRVSGKSPIGSRYDAVTTTTYWYAPQARAIVKSVHHNPYLGTTTVELVRASLQDGVPTGIRTPVTAVKGRCPRPLDDGDYRYCGLGWWR